MSEPTPKPNSLERMFERPLVEPTQGDDGLGPTVGEDVSPEKEEREDRRNGAHSEDQGAGI